MSEEKTLARKPNPEVLNQPPQPKGGEVNERKANAGINRIKNPQWSMQKCLVDAGYSPETARTQKSHGLSASACIAEAWKREPEAKPQNLLRKARILLDKRLDVGLTQDLKDVKLTDVARMVDTVERSYAASDADISSDARSFAVRLKWLQEVTKVLKKRDATVIDAEIVE